MFSYFSPEPPLPNNGEKTAVLLLNLGTPNAPNARSLRGYLKEFLSDKRVVELPSWLWQPLLRGVILPLRSPKSARNYAGIWTEQGSPLMHHTQQMAQALEHQTGIRTEVAMTYGQPAPAAVIARLKEEGFGRIVAVPLFPQYASSAGGAALDALWRALMNMRRQPAVCVVPPYYRHPAYIRALAAAINRERDEDAFLLFSFHGIPLAHEQGGDPYSYHCRETAHLTAQLLGLSENQWGVAFQSQFGKAPWILPNTQAEFSRLPESGIRRLNVVCPGFATDCLETLEEIQIEGRELFMNAGGTHYRYIGCLNAQEDWIDALAEIIRPFATAMNDNLPNF